MEAMKLFRKYQFKKIANFEKIYERLNDELKIGYININDLYHSRSIEFLNEDENLLALDFLVVVDTRLTENIEQTFLELKLSNWKIEARFDSHDKIKHMGMVVLKSEKWNAGNISLEITEKPYLQKHYMYMQVLFISIKAFNIECAFAYIRETPTEDQVNMLKEDIKHIDLLMGDLNLDPNRSNDVRKLENLCLQRKRVLTEMTTTRYNQIDHVLLNIEKFPVYFSTSFINYTTDHHAIVIRIAKPENNFKQSFLERRHFDKDSETRQSKRRKIEKDFIKKESTNKKDDLIEDISAGSPNLTCLFSPNWLNDEVIDLYFKLLNTVDNNVFIFTTYFMQCFIQRGFAGVQNYYRRKNLFVYKNIFIPVHQPGHWFLITYNGVELASYDSLNYYEDSQQKQKEKMELLTRLKDEYWKPLFKKYKKPYKELSIKIHAPPTIPSQNNTWDCGVFMISFVKCLILKKKFDFTNDDMIMIRDQIKRDLENEHIENLDVSSSFRHKRKQYNYDISAKKNKKFITGCKQRRITNNDAQTCWLNSCLQLIFTAMDHLDSIPERGSVLWDHLVLMQGKDPSSVLDPSDLKYVLINTERNRISRDNVHPLNRLFDLGNIPILYDEPYSVNSIGQQDCKDFFYAINENRETWPDVFNLFKVNTISSTQCVSCKNISSQEVGDEASTFIMFECPNSQESMKHFIENKLNKTEKRPLWRCEEGCGHVTIGLHSRKIENISETNFLIFILQRLIRIDGQLDIISTETIINQSDKIQLFDVAGRSAYFTPISIIHHSGNVSGESTQGHYRADVYNKNTQSWFRTSDNEPPVALTASGLTKQGYIFLYVRVK